MKRKLIGIVLIILAPLVLAWSVGCEMRVVAAVLWDNMCEYANMVKGHFAKPQDPYPDG